MRASVIFSGAVHAAIVVWASVTFPSAKQFEVQPMVSLPVEIIEASELTRIKAGKNNAPKAETPAAPAPEPPKEAARQDQPKRVEEPPKEAAALPPEPKPEPEAPKAAVVPPQPPRAEPEEKAEPAPKPKPDEPRQEQAKAPPTPLPAFRPAHTPPPKPKRPERKFEADKIAALLNKLPDKPQAAPSSEAPDRHEASLGETTGRDSTMSLNEIDALRQQIARCWSPPVGVQGAADLAVKVGLELNRDGSLIGEPEIISSGSGLGFQVAADAARRAVLRCQPYNLPPEKYDAWRRVNVNFDPRLMLGG